MKWSITLILAGCLLWIANVSGQQNKKSLAPDEGGSHPRSSLRERLHQKMWDRLFHDRFHDDFFKDIDQMMEESFRMMDQMGSSFEFGLGEQIQTQWEEGAEGMTLKVIPKDPKQPLDIKIENGFIHIQSKSSSQPHFQSQFSYSMNIPSGLDEKKVRMSAKDNQVHVFFPYRDKSRPQSISPRKSPLPDGRVPIKPDGQGEEI